MKRPQFSLRLMLLVVALFATIFGWWSITARLEHNRRLEQLRTNLESARSMRRLGMFDGAPYITAADVSKKDAEIKAIEKQIEEEFGH
jgi:hypothetical protein